VAVRDVVMKALEEQRMQKRIGSPLEAQVTLVTGDGRLGTLLGEHRQSLTEAFVVSDVRIVQAQGEAPGPAAAVPGLARVEVERAPGAKCQRCWKYLPSVGAHQEHPQLCQRCVTILQAIGARP
jgi:isoleucyl-tRNA synthetase